MCEAKAVIYLLSLGLSICTLCSRGTVSKKSRAALFPFTAVNVYLRPSLFTYSRNHSKRRQESSILLNVLQSFPGNRDCPKNQTSLGKKIGFKERF